MSKNFKNSKLALIGLIILFAISLVMAGGRRPPEMYSQLRFQPLSSSESQTIDNAYLQGRDRGKIAKHGRDWYKFETHALLKKIFPSVQFYKLESGITIPPTPYNMAYRNGKFYNLPLDFNRLLLDNNLEVTDKNIIELAKAFVVTAFMDDPHIGSWEGKEFKITEVKEITFLEGKKIKKRIAGDVYHAFLKIKVGDEIQEWYFILSPIAKGQFSLVSVGVPSQKSFKLRYHPFEIREKKHKEE